jgi:hypothetical protein
MRPMNATSPPPSSLPSPSTVTLVATTLPPWGTPSTSTSWPARRSEKVKMPAYRGRLREEEVARIIDHIHWLGQKPVLKRADRP